MSEATAKAVRDAQEVVRERARVVEDEKRACLRRVADELPVAIDAIAKKTATAQADVTRNLGVDGVKTLREELAAVAGDLAKDVASATESIKWARDEQSEWSQASARDVHSGMFHYFYGSRANRVASVFKRHGYDVHDTGRGRQGLVHPHSFYEEEWFTDVAQAINALAKAERDAARVKRADDDDAVADIWGNS